MGVEIVGEDAQARRRSTCRNCGAVLEYLPADVVTRTVGDYTGSVDTHYVVVCPRCKKDVRAKP